MEEYTPEEAIREIMKWTKKDRYGLYTGMATKLGVDPQRARTWGRTGGKSIILKVLLSILLAAQKEGSLDKIIKTSKDIKILTERKP